MSVRRLSLSFLAIALIVLSFSSAVYFDYTMKRKALFNLLEDNTEKFADMIVEINAEVYWALNKLKSPARCDRQVFEQLMYQYKHIKNMGVIQDDTIVCDVYEASLLKKPLIDYSTFEDENSNVFKYWKRGDYISVASPDGYFIEYDMNYYDDFEVDDEISGFVIIGRQSQDLWFSHQQHSMRSQDIQQAESHIVDTFKTLAKVQGEASTVLESDNLIYKLQAADDGSMAATYIHKDYLDAFRVINATHILAGLFIGMLFSYMLFSYDTSQRTLKSMLKKAIKHKEFNMVYQPLMDLTTTSPVIQGVEALVRWQLKNGDYVRPDVFIPIAEDAGLTHALTQCIIDKIFDDMHKHLQKNPHLYISINVTPSDLKDDGLIKRIQSYLDQYQLSPKQIVIELTERIIANEESIQGIEAIRQAGMPISIDDFGTGASNVHYLGKWNPDIIKVDRSFVIWSDGDGPTSTLLEKMVSMGKDFGVKVVVEGIETQAQAERCQRYGADLGQGYYWSKPLVMADLKPLIESS